MASVQTDDYEGRYLKLTLIEQSTSIENNTSTIKWTLESIGNSSTYYTIHKWGVWINGTTIFPQTTTNWDTKKFPAAAGSKSGTLTITHNNDGTASPVSFTLKGSVYYNREETYTGTLNLSTIKRKSEISVVKGGKDIADNYILITLSRKNSSFRDTISWSCSNLSETIQTKGADTKIMLCFDDNSYNNTAAPSGYTKKRSTYSNVDIMNKITSAKSINMTFTTTTYSGNTSLGSNPVTFKYEVYKTTYANNMSYLVMDNLSQSLTGETDVVIKHISSVKVTDTASKILNDNSTISLYKLAISDATHSGNSDNYTFYNVVGNVIAGEITDSRGFKTAASQGRITLDANHFIQYEKPSVLTFTGVRPESTSTTINLNITGTFWNDDFGSINNQMQLFIKKTINNVVTETEVTSSVVINNNNFSYTGTTTLAVDAEATLEARVVDATGSEYTLEISVPKGESIFDIGDGYFGVNGVLAVGKNGTTHDIYLNGNSLVTKLNDLTNKDIKFIDKYFSTPLNTNVNGIGVGNTTIDISSLNATEIIDVSFNLVSGNVIWVLKSNLTSSTTSFEVFGYRLSGPSTTASGARARILYR